MNKNLNIYASTIKLVFEHLAVLYKEGNSGDWQDAACDIVSILDADTCAEIITTAQNLEHNDPGVGVCVCGHEITDHSHSQWLRHWLCEHPDCECTDYQRALTEPRGE